MENIKHTKLYTKAKVINNYNSEVLNKPKIRNRIIKRQNFNSDLSNSEKGHAIEQTENSVQNQLPHLNFKKIESKHNIDNKAIKIDSDKNKIYSKPSLPFINSKNDRYSRINSYQFKKFPKKHQKNFECFLKQNILQTIQIFLDPHTLLNFLLCNKKFYKSVIENDELFYILYTKRFKTKNTKYKDHMGKWKEFFIKCTTQIHKSNYNSLKSKFIKISTQNSYTKKKDAYFITNNLFSFMKPVYHLEIDGKAFRIKNILSDKTLSHVNVFANFDENFIDLDKVKTLKLSISEKNLGLYNINLISYEFKKKKFNEFKSDSKICKIFYDNEFIISTFEKKYLFFLNISLPICKICEACFDFLKGIHDKNLNYFDDVDSKFGLFDYNLLINIKSWNNAYFTVNVNTLDFKDEGDNLYYENNGKSILFDLYFLKSCY